MTALWTAHDLIAATGGHLYAPFAASGVSIDSRTLAPGDLFVALRGESGDGHAHLDAAFARGAAGAMVHDAKAGGPLLRVADTLAGLTALGRFARARFTGRLVAITGSIGKTTAKEMLRTILAAEAPTHAAVASYNNHWGVPLTLARLPPGAAFCVAEIGMNHAGEIAPLARLARPHVALITTIAAAHVGHLGSLDAIAAEKAAILSGLEPGGLAVLPADSPHLPLLREAAGAARVLTFGAAECADVRLLGFTGDAAGSEVTGAVSGTRIGFRLPAPGRHMAINALAAIAAAAAVGVPAARAAAALAGFAPLAGRGAQRPILGGAAVLLDESYNASAPAVVAALEVLALIPAQRRLAVLGEMLELGAHAEAEHLSLAGPVARSADLLYACGAQMRRLFDAVPEGRRGGHAQDSAALAPLVAAAVRPGDAVLVKGSLGSRMNLVVRALEHGVR
jgi:UDP-N-acetylmuramoyl-tripeptide--D-alanyl-D-alanine ligase